MEEKFDKIKYITEYNKKTYTELRFRVKKGEDEVIKAHWQTLGYKSLSSYIKDLIWKDIEIRGGGYSRKRVISENCILKWIPGYAIMAVG